MTQSKKRKETSGISSPGISGYLHGLRLLSQKCQNWAVLWLLANLSGVFAFARLAFAAHKYPKLESKESRFSPFIPKQAKMCSQTAFRSLRAEVSVLWKLGSFKSSEKMVCTTSNSKRKPFKFMRRDKKQGKPGKKLALPFDPHTCWNNNDNGDSDAKSVLSECNVQAYIVSKNKTAVKSIWLVIARLISCLPTYEKGWIIPETVEGVLTRHLWAAPKNWTAYVMPEPQVERRFGSYFFKADDNYSL